LPGKQVGVEALLDTLNIPSLYLGFDSPLLQVSCVDFHPTSVTGENG
jgi:hypothetical protein